MLPACFLHHLSDFVPSEQHLAVPKKSRAGLPACQTVFPGNDCFSIRVSDFHLEEGNIRVFDPEKTVCDLFRLRTKTGEVVKNAVFQKGRDNRNAPPIPRINCQTIYHQISLNLCPAHLFA